MATLKYDWAQTCSSRSEEVRFHSRWQQVMEQGILLLTLGWFIRDWGHCCVTPSESLLRIEGGPDLLSITTGSQRVSTTLYNPLSGASTALSVLCSGTPAKTGSIKICRDIIDSICYPLTIENTGDLKKDVKNSQEPLDGFASIHRFGVDLVNVN